MIPQRFAIRVPLAIVLSTLFAFPGSALSAEETAKPDSGTRKGSGRLQVRVFGSDGKTAVPAAVVRAYHLESGQVFQSGRTTPGGDCSIAGLPYGYFDLSVETPDGYFAGNQVLNVPPSGSLAVSLSISFYADKPSAWWNGKAAREVPGTKATAKGLAEIHVKAKGRDFWKSPAGVAVIVGGGAAILVAASGGSTSSSSVSPSMP